MKEYEVIVLGSGAGAIIVEEALTHGLKVALIDKGPLGGTCLNVGCIPTKMLTFPADRVVEIQEAGKLGIRAEIKDLDFTAIMERMRHKVKFSRDHIRQGITRTRELDYYESEARFIEDFTLDVGGESIRGKKVIIASGARPLVPPIKGIEGVNYLTNESVLELKHKPESLGIIGGGYIAAEFGHFFAAMGTRVTILQRGERMVKEEEPEVSTLLERKMGERMAIHTQTEALEARRENGMVKITAKNVRTGEIREFTAERVLIAAGRTSNADILRVENTGVRTDNMGYIAVNDFFETSKENIWSFGDAIGKKMFRHAANHQARIVGHAALHGERGRMDFNKVPHAVFSYPPIASVGLLESEAKRLYDILIGRAKYSDVAKGEAMVDEDSFAKIILEKESGKILGFHIIGPYAPILIQEVTNAMTTGETVIPLINGMHIHPALPEVITATLGNLREAD